MKYFKGSDWLKASDKIIFNPDAISLAEHIQGKMDQNNNFVVSEPLSPVRLLASQEGFDKVKEQVGMVVRIYLRWIPFSLHSHPFISRTVN